jgi:hypothetical protein
MRSVSFTIPKVERPAAVSVREQIDISSVVKHLAGPAWDVITPVSLHIWRSLAKTDMQI